MAISDSCTEKNSNFLNHVESKAAPGPDPFTAFIRRLSPSSQVTMRYALQQVARLLEVNEALPLHNLPWHMIEQPQILELIERMEREGYSERTARVYLSAVRGVLSEAYRRELLSYRELKLIYDVRIFKGPLVQESTVIDTSDIAKLLLNCDEDWRLQGLRDGAIISLLSSCGFGRGDCVAACLDDLNQQDWSIAVTRPTGLVSYRWIAPGAVLRLRKWLEVRDSFLPREGPLFNRIRKGRKYTPQELMENSGPLGGRSPGQIVPEGLTAQAVYYVLAERSSACGIKVNSRELKNSFISRVIDKEGILFAQRLVGHTSPTTTYQHWSDRLDPPPPMRPTWSF